MALSNKVRDFITDMRDAILEGPFLAKRETLELLGAVTNYMESRDTQMVLSGASPAADARTATAYVKVKDANAIVNTFNQTSLVTVSISSGSASGKKINGGTAPVVCTMVDGSASVAVSATGTGTVVLGLSAPTPSGLTVTSTLTITFS